MDEGGQYSDISLLRLLLVRMEHTPQIDENGITLCGWCKNQTNGSQYHSKCFIEYLKCDEEVEQFMAENENSDKENMSPVRSVTPLSANVDTEEHDYYQALADKHELEYSKHTFNIGEFPKMLIDCIPSTGIVDDKISINRFLNGSCSILMYRLMTHKFIDSPIIHIPIIEMYCPVNFCLETKVAYHDYCEPDDIDTITKGCYKMCGITRETMTDIIKNDPHRFFCYSCEKHIITHYDQWDAKTLGDIATNEVNNYTKAIFTVHDKEDIVFQHLTEFDALTKPSYFSSSTDDECEPRIKKFKRN